MIEMRVSAGDLQSVPNACVEWKTEELCLPQRLSQYCLSESFFCIFMVTQRGTINLYFPQGDVGIDFVSFFFSLLIIIFINVSVPWEWQFCVIL